MTVSSPCADKKQVCIERRRSNENRHHGCRWGWRVLRMNELESMVGVIVGLGENHGVPTPVMAFAYAMLKPGLLKAKAS